MFIGMNMAVTTMEFKARFHSCLLRLHLYERKLLPKERSDCEILAKLKTEDSTCQAKSRK